jgi:small subunit ribosomal protein S7
MDKEEKYKIKKQDPRFEDETVAKFINHLMQGGKKSVARKAFYEACDQIAEKTEEDPAEVFHQAIRNIAPRLEIVSRRIGGAHYQIPKKVHGDRKETLAIRWLLNEVKNREDEPIATRMAEEIIKASNREGGAIQKRKNTHRMAEANKAFAHLAW